MESKLGTEESVRDQETSSSSSIPCPQWERCKTTGRILGSPSPSSPQRENSSRDAAGCQKTKARGDFGPHREGIWMPCWRKGLGILWKITFTPIKDQPTQCHVYVWKYSQPNSVADGRRLGRHTGELREELTLATKTTPTTSKWCHKTLRLPGALRSLVFAFWVLWTHFPPPNNVLVPENTLNKQAKPLLAASPDSDSSWCFVVRVKPTSQCEWACMTHTRVTRVCVGDHCGGCPWMPAIIDLGHFLYRISRCLSFPLPMDPERLV